MNGRRWDALAESIKGDFGSLRRKVDGRRVTYLDSAASTPSPDAVLAAEMKAREEIFANVHRGHHALADEATSAYDMARRRVARFLGAEPRCVVFVRNATEGINLVARGLGLLKDEVVLTTAGEHHSNLTPWIRAASVSFVDADPLVPLDTRALHRALELRRPRVFALQHASSVTGVIHPVADLFALAHEFGALCVLDASQSAPHLPLNVDSLGADFLTFSGHKMLAPKGIGVLWAQYHLLSRLEPLVVGGGAVDAVDERTFSIRPPPEGLEAGTPNVTGAIALAAAVDYLEGLGSGETVRHSLDLAAAMRELLGKVSIVKILGSATTDCLPITSLAVRGLALSADQVSNILSNTFGVLVRAGLQCTHPLFRRLDVPAAVRASGYVYNTEEDIVRLAEGLTEIGQRFGA